MGSFVCLLLVFGDGVREKCERREEFLISDFSLVRFACDGVMLLVQVSGTMSHRPQRVRERHVKGRE